MWQKAFHVVVVTFLVIFSAAVFVLLMAPLSRLIFQSRSHNGVFAYSGGFTVPVLKLIAFLVLLSAGLIISFVARRGRLR
jgi:hypothetical protein